MESVWEVLLVLTRDSCGRGLLLLLVLFGSRSGRLVSGIDGVIDLRYCVCVDGHVGDV